jgi:phosphatidylserine synthase
LIVNRKTDFWEGFGKGFGFGFVGIYLIAQPVVFLVQLFYKIYQTRSEQALICLAPFSGSRNQIDRNLRSYCFRQFAVLYGVSILSALIFILQWETVDLKYAALVLTITAIFPCVLTIPNKYAEMRSQNDHPVAWSLLPGGILLAVGLPSFVFIPFQAVWFYPMLVIPVTLFLLVRKLRKSRARIQFPAGWAV